MPSIFTEYLNKRIKELAAEGSSNAVQFPKARPCRSSDRIQQLATHSLVKPSQDGTDDSSVGRPNDL